MSDCQGPQSYKGLHREKPYLKLHPQKGIYREIYFMLNYVYARVLRGGVLISAVPAEFRRLIRSSEIWSYRQLWATLWMLENKPRSSVRSASAFNLWVIFPATAPPFIWTAFYLKQGLGYPELALSSLCVIEYDLKLAILLPLPLSSGIPVMYHHTRVMQCWESNLGLYTG